MPRWHPDFTPLGDGLVEVHCPYCDERTRIHGWGSSQAWWVDHKATLHPGE